MEGLPEVGDSVEFNDPWFYPGAGVVTDVQRLPHQAVEVSVTDMLDTQHQRWVGKKVWILPGHLTSKED